MHLLIDMMNSKVGISMVGEAGTQFTFSRPTRKGLILERTTTAGHDYDRDDPEFFFLVASVSCSAF
jgi:hypothetical protein